MHAPRLTGEIERRLLVNYRLDPGVAARALPAPFRPQLVHGSAVAGICLIRLGAMRPIGFPRFLGQTSENAAHRFAVEWDAEDGTVRSGVWIPRRDSSSWLNVALGGRVYPGTHHRAGFDVEESREQIRVAFRTRDGHVGADVTVRLQPELADGALFGSVQEASDFFERGSVGWSATPSPTRHDGLRLETSAWRVEPADVVAASSTFFEDQTRFPTGSVELDHALVMRRVPVDWHPMASLAVS